MGLRGLKNIFVEDNTKLTHYVKGEAKNIKNRSSYKQMKKSTVRVSVAAWKLNPSQFQKKIKSGVYS